MPGGLRRQAHLRLALAYEAMGWPDVAYKHLPKVCEMDPTRRSKHQEDLDRLLRHKHYLSPLAAQLPALTNTHPHQSPPHRQDDTQTKHAQLHGHQQQPERDPRIMELERQVAHLKRTNSALQQSMSRVRIATRNTTTGKSSPFVALAAYEDAEREAQRLREEKHDTKDALRRAEKLRKRRDELKKKLDEVKKKLDEVKKKLDEAKSEGEREKKKSAIYLTNLAKLDVRHTNVLADRQVQFKCLRKNKMLRSVQTLVASKAQLQQDLADEKAIHEDLYAAVRQQYSAYVKDAEKEIWRTRDALMATEEYQRLMAGLEKNEDGPEFVDYHEMVLAHLLSVSGGSRVQLGVEIEAERFKREMAELEGRVYRDALYSKGVELSAEAEAKLRQVEESVLDVTWGAETIIDYLIIETVVHRADLLNKKLKKRKCSLHLDT
ncbi:unnamed protein product [Vitrella brassicaformis CCMP3155]|uniref:Uncharacterized protein n=1 Tax=Vitrella brassicaformis (strain CCMP3155) TaxID=1169540 RepID=A0A0G4FQL6_VITBC|nr:unnamed protein product [Vitrella brassicaformis CCMP3155]|eukprot:CEM16734.1 unnamed protein product [Vitrella brassicaformis CCMP3155]